MYRVQTEKLKHTRKKIETDTVPMKGDMIMLLLLVIPIVAFILWSLADNLDGHKGMKEFCDMECRSHVAPRCSICD